VACGIFTVSYEIFIIVVYGIFVAACGIVTAACGIFSCGTLDIFNCHRQNLYCGMESFKLWYVGSFMQHEFFFFFAACGILVVACRSYKLSHVGSLLQHARSFYFWHVGCFSCGMRNLLVAACGIISVVIHVIFIVVCGICVAA